METDSNGRYPERLETQYSVLVLDENPMTLRFLETYLPQEGFEVHVASEEVQARDLLIEKTPDLLIVNLDSLKNLGMNDLLENWRLPYIVLSKEFGTKLEAKALDEGASHFQPKPIDIVVLGARCRATVRDRGMGVPKEEIISTGDLEVNIGTGLVRKNGEFIRLPRTEWNLIRFFVLNKNKVLPYQDILTKNWGWGFADDRQFLRVWVSRLKKKIEDDPARPKILRTVHGIGYIFCDPDYFDKSLSQGNRRWDSLRSENDSIAANP